MGYLILSQTWPCSGLIQYTIDWGAPSIYTTPVVINNGQIVVIEWVDNWSSKKPCCFQYRDFGTYGELVTDNPYRFVVEDKDKDIIATAVLNLCDDSAPCTPRYKDVETLVQKANCICSWIGVEAIENFCDSDYTGFVIYDKCQPDDKSPSGTGFYDIMVVSDPNYLLAIIECLCGQQRTSSHGDYILSPVQP